MEDLCYLDGCNASIIFIDSIAFDVDLSIYGKESNLLALSLAGDERSEWSESYSLRVLRSIASLVMFSTGKLFLVASCLSKFCKVDIEVSGLYYSVGEMMFISIRDRCGESGYEQFIILLLNVMLFTSRILSSGDRVVPCY